MLEEWKAAGGDPKKRPRPRFKLTSVFDLAQVAPLPAPATVIDLEPPFDLALEGEELAELIAPGGPFETLAAELGLTLTFQARDGGGACGGYFAPAEKQIVVYADTTANSQAATAAHALVRLDRHDDDPHLDYTREEFVLESVAFSVMSARHRRASQHRPVPGLLVADRADRDDRAARKAHRPPRPAPGNAPARRCPRHNHADRHEHRTG